MLNVEVKTKGPSVTPRADESTTAVAEAELLMTSGLLIVIILFVVCICFVLIQHPALFSLLASLSRAIL